MVACKAMGQLVVPCKPEHVCKQKTEVLPAVVWCPYVFLLKEPARAVAARVPWHPATVSPDKSDHCWCHDLEPFWPWPACQQLLSPSDTVRVLQWRPAADTVVAADCADRPFVDECYSRQHSGLPCTAVSAAGTAGAVRLGPLPLYWWCCQVSDSLDSADTPWAIRQRYRLQYHHAAAAAAALLPGADWWGRCDLLHHHKHC